MTHWRLIFLLATYVYTVFGQTESPPVGQASQTAPPTPANNQVCLIVPPDVEECYRHFKGKPIEDKAAQVNCLQKLLWNVTPDINNTVEELNFFKSLAGDIASYKETGVNEPRPPTGRRERREYRTLSRRERQRFHDALNRLYEDGTIRAFARLHARAYNVHGNGPSFLPWFRVYLVMFEEALRRIDPKVFLPFWDVTIDNDMDNPVNSMLWKPEYFGNGVGDVISGAAAGWVTDQGNLERNYGQSSRLYSKDQIRRVLSKCELQDISQPSADLEFDFEWYQGSVHAWIGGDMKYPATAGYDPIFYMHHAFNDYIFELFRRRQFGRCNIDPTTNYPSTATGGHAPDATMTGFDWLTNVDGLKSYWVSHWYSYQSTPSCPNCCRDCTFPAPIYCNNRRQACVARSRRSFNFDNQSPEEAFAQASLDPAEIDAISNPPPPRNRGVTYRHSPSDGRSIHTAISDAFASISPGLDTPAEEIRRRGSSPDRRTLRDRQGGVSRRVGPTRGTRPARDPRRGAASGSTRQDRRVPPTSRRDFIDRGRFDRRSQGDPRRGRVPISNRLSRPADDTPRRLQERRPFPTSDRRRGIVTNTLEQRSPDRRRFGDGDVSGRRRPDIRSMAPSRSDFIPFQR